MINTYSKEVHENKPLRILEALAASGIRSIRYALEIANVDKTIVANDLDQKAVALIDTNILFNQVSNIVKSNCDDAIMCLSAASRSKSEQFDCIDLDPYGSPAAFLDSSIRAIKSGGLMLVTATDAAILCGNLLKSAMTLELQQQQTTKNSKSLKMLGL